MMTVALPDGVFIGSREMRYPLSCCSMYCGKTRNDPGGCNDGCQHAPKLFAFEAAKMVSGARCDDETWAPNFYTVPESSPVRFVLK